MSNGLPTGSDRPDAAEDIWSRAARFGAFFDITTAAGAADGGWLELRALADEPALARERVARSAELMTGRLGLPPGSIPDRVIASIGFVSLAARLVAPPFGAALAAGRAPLVDLDGVRWQQEYGGPLPLLITPRGWREGGVEELAGWLVSDTVESVVAAVVNRFAITFRLSLRVLWGNVASAVAGTARAAGMADPNAATAAALLATEMLQRGPLAGTAVTADPRRPDWRIRRRSCCLFYRVPNTGYCGDCVLTPH